MIILGNCLKKLKDLESESIDAVVTDPPYELGFMGKKWDNTGIAYNVELWKECLRVLKAGGHLLAFSGTRTYHRMACAIEDTGFEVRDMLEWIYSQGFPKSLNVGKMYNKIKGTSEWEGFGTALKPAHEPIIMARKPLSEKTIVENVLKHGTGAIDIDGCRIPTTSQDQEAIEKKNKSFESANNKEYQGIQFVNENRNLEASSLGRFPANVLCTDDALNDGVMTKSVRQEINVKGRSGGILGKEGADRNYIGGHNDSGSKSRYFDIDVWAEKHGLLQFPKASKRERNEGCEGLEEKQTKGGGGFTSPTDENGDYIVSGDKGTAGKYGSIKAKASNNHPTVKPVHLMSWLVRLVSKEGDTVLDPFMGSGTTGVACKKLNRNFIGIELNEEYIKIAEARIKQIKQQILI